MMDPAKDLSDDRATITLLDLSVEILLIILDLLPALSRVILALTCKTFLTRLGVSEDLCREDVRELLVLLESDDPHSSVCFGCNRLAALCAHPTARWRNKRHYECGGQVQRKRSYQGVWDMVRSRWSGGKVHQDNFKHQLHTWIPEQDGPEISFTHAHLIMRRHFYGESHGLPIESLDHSYTFQRQIPTCRSMYESSYDHFPIERHPPGSLPALTTVPPRRSQRKHTSPAIYSGPTEALITQSKESFRNPAPKLLRPLTGGATLWEFQHQYSAKIIDDELYISRSHRVVGPPNYKGHIAGVVSGVRLPFCIHLVGDPLRRYTSYYALNRFGGPLGEFRSDSCPRSRTVESVPLRGGYWYHSEASDRKSCDICLTEYESTCYFQNDRFHLEVKTYHRLGSCRTPDDPVWKCLVMSRHDWDYIYGGSLTMLDLPRDQARVQWYKDGTIDESENWRLWDV